MRVSTRLTTNAGASATSTPRFFSFLTTSHAVASCSSVVCGVRTISTSGRTATGLKKCSPTSAPISSTESDDVFVARIASGATLRTSAKTSRFTSSSSKTASSTRSQPANCSQPVPPSTIVARNGLRAPTSSRIVASASSTRAWSRSRRTTGTSSRRRKSVASCVAISPAPTMPTFCTLRGFASGQVRRLLRAPLDDGERIRGRLRLRADEELRHRVLLGGVALLDRPVLRARDQVERDVRRARRAVHRVVDPRACLAHDGFELRPVRRRVVRGCRARARTAATRRRTRPARAAGRRCRARTPPAPSAACSGATG